MSRVLITGVTGYIGAWVTKKFLDDGSFTVKGTVRSKTNAAKIDPLKKSFGDNFDKLELVEADLLNEQSMIDACADTDIIVHVASPYPAFQDKTSEKLLCDQAVGGTMAIMKGAQKHGVKKVVITSSVAAVAYGHPAARHLAPFSGEDFSVKEKVGGYILSKLNAEQAAWAFHKALPDGERFELCTICPAAVWGPMLTNVKCASADMLKFFLSGELPAYPRVSLGNIDVRDVAEAHLQAVLKDGVDGKRFILAEAQGKWMSEIGGILLGLYKDSKRYPISEGDMSYCFVSFLYIMSCCD